MSSNKLTLRKHQVELLPYGGDNIVTAVYTFILDVSGMVILLMSKLTYCMIDCLFIIFISVSTLPPSIRSVAIDRGKEDMASLKNITICYERFLPCLNKGFHSFIPVPQDWLDANMLSLYKGKTSTRSCRTD